MLRIRVINPAKYKYTLRKNRSNSSIKFTIRSKESLSLFCFTLVKNIYPGEFRYWAIETDARVYA